MSTNSTMSTSDDNSGGQVRQRREPARRLFAREFNDATYQFKESTDERAPNYALLPTGEKANRVLIAGTAVEVEDIGEDSEYWRVRVHDGSALDGEDATDSQFYIYAGQYQPEAAAVIRELDTPAYVTVVGKPRVYEKDNGDVNVSIRPESLTVVEQEGREAWILETAQLTFDRIEAFEEGSSAYGDMALEEYPDVDIEKYRNGAIASLKSILGEELSVDDVSEGTGAAEPDSGDDMFGDDFDEGSSADADETLDSIEN